MQTGAAFDGRALAQTAVTLDANSIVLGLDDLGIGDGFAMYPNPAQNNVTIANSTSIKLDQSAIYDVNGRLIKTIDLRDIQQERTIDVSNLSSGVYMVQIQGEGASIIKRLIKM